jgi:hypothetical protein
MEYFIGSVATLIAVVVFAMTTNNISNRSGRVSLKRSQSRSLQLILSAGYNVVLPIPPINKDTQAHKHNSKNEIRVVIHEDFAYWIQNNAFLTAKVRGGVIDQTTTKLVDTLAMDKVELDKISFIVEKLNERQSDDRSNPGHKGL